MRAASLSPTLVLPAPIKPTRNTACGLLPGLPEDCLRPRATASVFLAAGLRRAPKHCQILAKKRNTGQRTGIAPLAKCAKFLCLPFLNVDFTTEGTQPN